jgi:hypothetical protein
VLGTDWKTGLPGMPIYNLTFSNNSITLFDLPVLVPDQMNAFSDLTVIGEADVQVIADSASYVNAEAKAQLDVYILPFAAALVDLSLSASINAALGIAGQFVALGRFCAGFIGTPPPLFSELTHLCSHELTLVLA